MGPMPAPDRNPLAATQRLLVDGTNLLHSMSRTAGAAPAATLIGRLRAIIPADVAIELIFDGPPERGLRNERIASGTTVRYGGPSQRRRVDPRPRRRRPNGRRCRRHGRTC